MAPNVYMATTLTQTAPFTRSDEIVFIINQSNTVSTMIMPDLSSSSWTDIEAWALSSNVTVSLNTVFSDTVPADKFVSQSVLPNAILASGSELSVSFSKGAAVIMADFRTMDEAQAKLWASLNNLTLSLDTLYSSTKEGTLISQSVKAGTALEAKSMISLTYSLGNTITIGSYVNASLPSLQSFIDAQNKLAANLTLSVTTQYSSTIALNRIIAVSVSDTTLAKGSSIDVIVSLGALVKVPDFALLSTGDYLSTYNALLGAAKTANVTIRIKSVDDPTIADSELTITQSLSAETLCSSADIIDLILTH
jgi:beta-lactam-binding protein with PASTA domain